MNRFWTATARRRKEIGHRPAMLAVFTFCILASVFGGAPAHADNVPSNDADAFRRFDLYVDRTASQGTSDHVNISAYPSSVNSTQLLALRSAGDTVCVINSEPYDAINMEVDNLVPQAYCEYTLSPARYATSVAVILMAYNVFSGTGGFNDPGKVVARITAHYSDGTSVVSDDSVAVKIRDWSSGSIFCGATEPFYTVPPSSPLAGVLWSDAGNTTFYDVCEFRLPASKRNTTIDRVRIEAVLQDHFCSSFVPHVYAGIRLHGVSSWPDFQTTNRNGQTVQLQSQGGSWGGNSYGGYRSGGALISPRSTIGRLGCYLTCVSMLQNYFGITSQPDTLNSYLQWHGGYGQQLVADRFVVGSQSVGSTFTFRPRGRDIAANAVFVVERSFHVPLVVAQVTSISGSGATRTGTAQILQHFQDIQPTDGGFFYSKVDPVFAAEKFSGEHWRLNSLPASPSPVAAVEAALADSLPAMLNVKGGGHWVLADGMAPAYVASATNSRGTYRLKDPGFGATRLVQVVPSIAPYYNNRFGRANIPERLTGFPVPGALPQAPLAATSSIFFILDGPVAAVISDPLSQTIQYDAGADDYTVGIPNAVVIRGYVDEDVIDPANDGAPVDLISIPAPLDGNYTVTVLGQGADSYALSVSSANGTDAVSGAQGTANAQAGSSQQWVVQYSGASGVVVVSPSTGVGSQQDDARLALFVRPNPTTGPASISFTVPLQSDVSLSVFDLQGRLVQRLVNESMSAGLHNTTWDGRDASGQKVRAGVYLMRLAVAGRRTTQRVVFVP